MIIDKICDAMDGDYNPRDFYNYVNENEALSNDISIGGRWPISTAMDSGTNADVKRELCNYIDANLYNADIKKFINKFTWVED
jgi:hypothetical protein